jgi:hypothetical protein
MALGQLFDYSRWVVGPRPRLAVLLPQQPVRDLVDLLTEHGIKVVWENSEGRFESEELHRQDRDRNEVIGTSASRTPTAR